MNYIKGIITTTHDAADIIADSISPLCGACIIDDPKTVEELISSPSPRWDYIGEEVFENPDRPVTVSFFVDNTEEGIQTVSEIKKITDDLKNEGLKDFYGSLDLVTVIVEDENWQNNWKNFFKPFSVGSGLIIRPSWEEADVSGKKELVIDPASSFGTGSHATTKMCLERFQEIDLKGKKVLDAGCGSGILACASLLLGANHALAFDIEENAMTATAENMRLNSIPNDRWNTLLGNVINDPALRNTVSESGPFDLIVANIVADVVMEMLPFFLDWLAKGGKIIVSGIIDTRADEVLNAYLSSGLKLSAEKRDSGWAMFEFN